MPIVLMLTLGVGVCGATAEERLVSVSLEHGHDLHGCIFFPDASGSGRLPAVIVATGAGGTKLIQYREYCRNLSKQGFAALLVDGSNYPEYLTPGPDTWRRMPYHIWSWVNHFTVAIALAFDHRWYIRNIREAVDYLYANPKIIRSKIGLSGFSQSANAVLAEASEDSRVRCVVWNNGGWPWIMPYEPKRLPPVLIFHGEDDGVYNVKYAHNLADELKAAGKDYECHVYPHQRHMFTIYYELNQPPEARNPALISSFHRLVGFLDRVLRNNVSSPEPSHRAHSANGLGLESMKGRP